MSQLIDVGNLRFGLLQEKRHQVEPFQRSRFEIDQAVTAFLDGIMREAELPYQRREFGQLARLAAGYGLIVFALVSFIGFFIGVWTGEHNLAGGIVMAPLIAWFGMKVVENSHRAARSAVANHFKRQTRPVRGLAYRVVGYFLLTLALLIWVAFVNVTWGDLTFVVGGIAVFSTVSLVLGGRASLRRGRRLSQLSADEAISADPREPVVLIRSFLDDRIHIESDDMTFDVGDVISGQGTPRVNTFEAALSDQLIGVGPLIAVGEPGDKLPQIGASRAYLPNDSWKEHVAKWLDDARLIVAVVGSSQGLKWELGHAVATGKVEKMIFVFPPTKELERWAAIQDIMAAAGTKRMLPVTMPSDLRVFYCEPTGEPMFLCSKGSTEGEYERAIRFALFGLFVRRSEARNAGPLRR